MLGAPRWPPDPQPLGHAPAEPWRASGFRRDLSSRQPLEHPPRLARDGVDDLGGARKIVDEAGALPGNALEEIIGKAKALDMAKVHEEIAKGHTEESAGS